jgi:hypothetical protein
MTCVSVESLDAWSGAFSQTEAPDVLTKHSSNVALSRLKDGKNGNGDEISTLILEHISKLQARHEQRVRQLFKEQEQTLVGSLSVPTKPRIRIHDPRAPLAPDVPVPASFNPSLSPRSLSSGPDVAAPVAAKTAPPPCEEAPMLPGTVVDRLSVVEGESFMAHRRTSLESPRIVAVSTSEKVGRYDKQKAQLESLKALGSKKNAAKPTSRPDLNNSRSSVRTVISDKLRGEGTVREIIEALLLHPAFELCVAGVVVFNALIIGLQADFQVKHVHDDVPEFYYILDVGCTVLFTLEILLRLYVERCFFFDKTNSNRIWNLLDMFIVILSLFDEAVMVAFISDDDANVSFTRLFRTIRLARLLRMVKLVRFFNDLRVMCNGIVCSMKSLVWALLLLGLIMYIFSLCLLQFVAMKLADLPPGDEQTVQLEDNFGTLVKTMRTLTMSITGGIDWADASTPLGHISGLLELLFVLYVLFAVLCVLNIVTGIFVETANKAYEEDESRLMLEDAKSRFKAIETIKSIFEETDMDGSGFVDFHEFKLMFHDPRIQYCFRKVGINIESECVEGLFKVLDFDGNNTVSLDEFILALQHFAGPARSIDLVRILYEVKKVKQEVLQMNPKKALRADKSKKLLLSADDL